MSALRLASATRNSLAACVKTAIVNAAGHLDGCLGGTAGYLRGSHPGDPLSPASRLAVGDRSPSLVGRHHNLTVADTRPGCACMVSGWRSALRRPVWLCAP